MNWRVKRREKAIGLKNSKYSTLEWLRKINFEYFPTQRSFYSSKSPKKVYFHRSSIPRRSMYKNSLSRGLESCFKNQNVLTLLEQGVFYVLHMFHNNLLCSTRKQAWKACFFRVEQAHLIPQSLRDSPQGQGERIPPRRYAAPPSVGLRPPKTQSLGSCVFAKLLITSLFRKLFPAIWTGAKCVYHSIPIS